MVCARTDHLDKSFKSSDLSAGRLGLTEMQSSDCVFTAVSAFHTKRLLGITSVYESIQFVLT